MWIVRYDPAYEAPPSYFWKVELGFRNMTGDPTKAKQFRTKREAQQYCGFRQKPVRLSDEVKGDE